MCYANQKSETLNVNITNDQFINIIIIENIDKDVWPHSKTNARSIYWTVSSTIVIPRGRT